jgi:hypothetical protein
MLERKDAVTKEVLEPITFVLVYPTVFHADKASDSVCKDANPCILVSVSGKCAVMLFVLGVLILYELSAVFTL